jgi:hypothetical protein
MTHAVINNLGIVLKKVPETEQLHRGNENEAMGKLNTLKLAYSVSRTGM